MECNIFTANSQGLKTQKLFPIGIQITNLESLIMATEKDHTVINFDGERKAKNFKSANALFADIDNMHTEESSLWITLDKLKKTFAEYSFAVTPSRNHMKDKGHTAARPRWHLYFEVPKITDQEKFKGLMTKLINKYPTIHFDPAVKDAGRFFFGHGGGFDADQFWIQDGGYISKNLSGPRFDRARTQMSITELTSQDILKHPEWVTEGMRHAALIKVAVRFYRAEKTRADIYALMYDLNNKLTSPKETSEIDSIISWVRDNIEETGEDYFETIRNFEWALGDDGKYHVEPVRVITPEMYNCIENFMAFEDISGGRQMSLRKTPKMSVNNPAQFANALLQAGYKWDIRKTGGLTKSEIFEVFRNRVSAYSRLTCTPEHNMSENTFLFNINGFPEPQNTGAFREYLDIFTFESIEDKYRFASSVVSMFLNSDYDGKIPIFTLRAPSQNSGKTTVVRETVQLVTGLPIIEQTGEDIANDTAQFTGVSAQASRAVLYDNLEKLKAAEERSIVRTVTDVYRQAWFFGQSRSRIRNSYVYFATFNDSESFGRDLQARAVVIKMRDPDEVSTEERDRIDAGLIEWRERRDELMADIMWLMNNQTEDVRVKPIQKFTTWSAIVSGILKSVFPEVKSFDFSPKESHRISTASDTLQEFFLDHIKTVEKPSINQRYELSGTAKQLLVLFNSWGEQAFRGYDVRNFGVMLSQSARDLRVGELTKRIATGLTIYTYSINEDEKADIVGLDY